MEIEKIISNQQSASNKQLLVKRGFSLTEVLVVFAITMIMTAVAVSMSQNNKSEKNLETTGRALAALLRQAQNDALAGKLPITGNSSTVACGYAFVYGISDMNSNRTGYRGGYVSKDPTNGCQNNDTITLVPSKVNKPFGNVLKDLVNVNYDIKFEQNRDRVIYFNLPRADIFTDRNQNYNDNNPKVPTITGNSAENLNAEQVITLMSSKTGTSRFDICIFPSGDIKEGKLRDVSEPVTC